MPHLLERAVKYKSNETHRWPWASHFSGLFLHQPVGHIRVANGSFWVGFWPRIKGKIKACHVNAPDHWLEQPVPSLPRSLLSHRPPWWSSSMSSSHLPQVLCTCWSLSVMLTHVLFPTASSYSCLRSNVPSWERPPVVPAGVAAFTLGPALNCPHCSFHSTGQQMAVGQSQPIPCFCAVRARNWEPCWHF